MSSGGAGSRLSSTAEREEDMQEQSVPEAKEERMLKLPGREAAVPYSEFLEEERRIINSDFKPTFVSVQGLTITVNAPKPTSRQRNVTSTLMNLTKTVTRKSKTTARNILHELDFYLRPGEMTLLLGAPGCGKSVLLKLLADQLHVGQVSGSVTFNGKVPDRNLHHCAVAYVQQSDVHFPTLTVQETLQFSADCQMPSGVSKATRETRVEAILQLLGLQHRADTIIGDDLLRGVSGGEKKRVTIGIEWTKSPGVWLFDEPTTGLDSKAAFDVLRAIRTTADTGGSVLVSLLQPSMDVFRLFDKVLIMTHGQIAYFGSRQEALPYFARLGYSCPPQLNHAEFLQEVVESSTAMNRSKYRLSSDKDEKDEGDSDDSDFKWLEPSEFVELYKQSNERQQILLEIQQHHQEVSSSQQKAVTSSSSSSSNASEEEKQLNAGQLPLADRKRSHKYPTSIFKQYWLLAKRALKREWRDFATNRARLVGTSIEAFIIGTLFLRLGHVQSDAVTRLGLIFSILAFFTFESLAALPVAILERPVFYMQRAQKYYHTSPYLVSHLIAEVPMVLIEVTLFSTFVYWLTGLSDLDAGGRFGYFFFLLILYYLVMRSFTRMICTYCPSLQVAQTITPPCLAFFLLFAGFIVPRMDIKGWWIWMYWANPTTYVFQGMMSNEFWGQSYHCALAELAPPANEANFNEPYPAGYQSKQVCPMTDGTEYAIERWGVFDGEDIKWAMVPALIGWYAIFNTLTYIGLRFFPHAPPSKPIMKEAIYSEDEEREMLEFNIKDHKQIMSGGGAGMLDDDEMGTSKVESDQLLQGGAYLSWHHLNYTVSIRTGFKKEPLQLLHDVSGYVKPGSMLALMGSSGAGKSTLMDVLAGRKTGGIITGDILVNGKPTDSNLARVIGYVEQQDLHIPTQTILEALEFSAFCRLPHYIPRETKRKYALSLLNILGLEKKAHCVIGRNAADGISADERKRVTIGVEMAADPAILFLDEPTSGLDSKGAERVMRAVKNIAARGTSVVCTIHQPSKTLFSMFSHLLLLKKGTAPSHFLSMVKLNAQLTHDMPSSLAHFGLAGGYVTYFGPLGTTEGDCSVLLGHFAALGKVIGPEENPADFILSVASSTGSPGGGGGGERGEEEHHIESSHNHDEHYFVNAYKESTMYATAEKELSHGILGGDPDALDDGDIEISQIRRWMSLVKRRLTDRYASWPLTQLNAMWMRGMKSYWRQPEEFAMKLGVPLLMGIILGTYFLQLDNDQSSGFYRVGLLYYALLFSNMGALQLKANLVLSRPFMYRERSSRTYSSFIYLISLVAVETPFILINTVTFAIPVYFIAGLQYEAGRFWIFFAIYLLANFVSLVLVYTLCFSAPNIAVANVMAGIVFTALAMFAGFIISRDKIPNYWIWFHYMDVNVYPIEALLINEVDGMGFRCAADELVQVPISPTGGLVATYCPITTGEQLLDSMGMSEANLLRNSLVLLGWFLFYFLSSAALLKCVVHQKR